MWQGTVKEWADALDVGPDDLTSCLSRIVRELETAHANVIGIEEQIVDIPDDTASHAVRFAGIGLAAATELLMAALITARAEVG